ncbi:Spy/CpxP family protein refolding chaperone [Bradyrhizobium diazoefficiens]|nr:Spy/CpxP family protein refolding chaperone [Bradyrhizobium diazoefficiens]MBR0965549.1 Spy/CpxP family protein refolding chaperone [Bradyrhizobium diazoefficiens]MBR0979240.1 Spy/CpxP family protein refolding chaperone [Bradyrhizobium diazoefficiens]MBR1008632.1 Spy/CpxP family protein refolding chaperone [Bradyrhizobium diazoefficiens]MBR1014619.1 Spy/CpxP family protein refolding chaperone [Bradyrhizobium diazoefficiens]MBR1052593.1 Spy/CpxP family protein refolding chaperone [Bradyrhizo
MRALTFAAALLVTMIGHSVWAQSNAEHQDHHPNQKEAPAAKAPAAPEPPPGAGPSQGMTGGGMMNMMGGNMPMSNMMRMMGMMRQSGDGLDTIDRVEGRIAFLRTELKITDAQTPAWNAFADALRANAKTLGELRTSMMSQAGSETLVDRLTWQEKWLSARLESTRAMKSALTNLVGSFSDEQKKTAEDVLAPNMGMMPMMSGVRGADGMGMEMPARKSPQ